MEHKNGYSHEYMHEHHMEHEHPHHHSHTHTHDPAEVKAIVNRISRASGHLDSVKHMVEEGRDCSEVLIQLSAVISALNNTGKELLKQHISHCMVEAVRDNDYEAIEELNRAIDKFMKP